MWKNLTKKEVEQLGKYDEGKESKKELVIKNRIKTIYNKLKAIYDAKVDKVKVFMFLNVIPTYPSSTYVYYYCLDLNTKFGERYLLVNNEQVLFYLYKKPKSYPLCGFVEPYSGFMFKISFCGMGGNSVKIEPEPMVGFTPKEIDLAILEFENAIEPIYQEALKRESKHKACIEYFSEVVDE